MYVIILETQTASSQLTDFEAIVEHENVGATVVKALCDIADSLPRVELANSLYPTAMMQRAIALLYGHIVRFLVRALDWYEESKLAHALHSITRPASLRYDDLIKDIHRDAQSITSYAITSSQAEQRDMHIEIRAIRSLVDSAITRNQNEQQNVDDKLSALTETVARLQESILLDQSVHANARIDIRIALAEMQLTQALTLISSQCNIDHQSSFRASVVLRDRHRYTSRLGGAWSGTLSKLRDWNSSPGSSTILLKAGFRERLELRDVCTNVIEQLVASRVATLWVLKSRSLDYSVLEVLKSLIVQAISLDYSSHTDVAFSFQLRKYLDARLDEDYLDLLGDILQHFKLVYIIADAWAMSPDTATLYRVYLDRLSQRLSERGVPTVMKVIISYYGPGQLSAPQSTQDVVLKFGKTFPQRIRMTPKQYFHSFNHLPSILGWQKSKGPSARSGRLR